MVPLLMGDRGVNVNKDLGWESAEEKSKY